MGVRSPAAAADRMSMKALPAVVLLEAVLVSEAPEAPEALMDHRALPVRTKDNFLARRKQVDRSPVETRRTENQPAQSV